MSTATDDPDTIFKITEGLCYLSVCVPAGMDREVVESRVRAEWTAGTTRGWRLCDDPTFVSGEPNPCPCDMFPATRLHHLFSC